MALQELLRGTGVALITPFDNQGAVDFDALGRVIDHVISGQVEYVVTLGTTGETPTLSKEEKIKIIEYTYTKVADRVPIIVGVGGNDTQALIKDLQTLPLDKAVAVLSASPYYSKPSQEGIYQHYKALAAASPKPLLLYNVPGRTGRNVNASTVIRLAKEVPNIVGIKDASGDMTQCIQLLRDRPEGFLVLSGEDGLILPQIACGMDGIISVAANALPAQFSSMVRTCLKGDFSHAKKMNDPMIVAYDMMFEENNPAGVKAFMATMGLIENNVRLPVVPVSEGLQGRIDAWVKG